jgi:hypothetical protein
MILFSQSFFVFLIITALAWTAIGGIVLLCLLVRDARRKQIW